MDVPPGLVITVTDARRAGYCARGVKAWIDAHALDFGRVLKEGIAAERLLETGDALAERVVAARLGRL